MHCSHGYGQLVRSDDLIYFAIQMILNSIVQNICVEQLVFPLIAKLRISGCLDIAPTHAIIKESCRVPVLIKNAREGMIRIEISLV